MKKIVPALVAAMFVGGFVFAQNVVDQGMPGNQGPWPVTGSLVISGFDGGSSIGTYPVQCRSTALDAGSVEANTTVGGTAQRVPSVGAAPGTSTASSGRAYMVACNSAQNASTAIIKCRQDGTAPVFAAGNAGQVLLFGDCLVTTAPTGADVFQCIGSGAGLNVTTYECIPL